MIPFLINFLILILILGIIWAVANWVIGYAGLPEPANKVLHIALVIILLIYILGFFGGYGPSLMIWRR